MDQPLAALEVYRTGLDSFPGTYRQIDRQMKIIKKGRKKSELKLKFEIYKGDTHLLTGVARIQEALGNLQLSAKYYKVLLYELQIQTANQTSFMQIQVS